MTVLRWAAIAIAALGVWDPSIRLPRAERPAVQIIGDPTPAARALSGQLRQSGFDMDGARARGASVTAEVTVGDHPPDVLPDGPVLWALDTTPRSPGIRIVEASAPDARFPEQAIEVTAIVQRSGVSGTTTDLVLEDSGIIVASARHVWPAEKESPDKEAGENARWQASLRYLPPGNGAGVLRVRVVAAAGQRGDVADLRVPAVRGPTRTLVFEDGVSWPAVFVRRTLEGEPAFAVASLQRASKNVATRAGSPPAALTRQTLTSFEVVVIGGPDRLTSADVEALRWFVENRGGLAVLIPDGPSAARYATLLGGAALEARALSGPVALYEDEQTVMHATEILMPAALPPGARALATLTASPPPLAQSAGSAQTSVVPGLASAQTPLAAAVGSAQTSEVQTSRFASSETPSDAVVFTARRGEGAVIFSGALDAWRYRGADNDAYGRFWRRAIVEAAAAVPPVLDVRAEPSAAAVGSEVRITARLRGTELRGTGDRVEIGPASARAVSPGARRDSPIRLWPTAEPGVFTGDWRAPAAGDYDIAVAVGEARADAAVTVTATMARGSAADPEGLALATRATGGRVFRVDQSEALVAAMRDAYPAQRVLRRANPMRSPWWVLPFVGMLCAEWAARRRRGAV